MSEGAAIIWSAVATGILTLVGWLARRAYLRYVEDSFRIEGRLSVAGDVTFIERIGCAGLLLTLIGRGNRIAKVAHAEICVSGVDLLPAFQVGFGTDFGHQPVTGAPPPVFCIRLVPYPNVSDTSARPLGRDDMIHFALPIQIPALPTFAKAPPENVSVVVELLDGTTMTVLAGDAVRVEVDTLIQVWGKARQRCHVPVEIKIKTTSKAAPDVTAVGTVNEERIDIGITDSGNVVLVDEDERQLRKLQHLFEAILPRLQNSLHPPYVVFVRERITGLVLEKLHEKQFFVQTSPRQITAVSLVELVALFKALFDAVDQLSAAAEKNSDSENESLELRVNFNLDPTPELVSAVLRRVRVLEPGETQTDPGPAGQQDKA